MLVQQIFYLPSHLDSLMVDVVLIIGSQQESIRRRKEFYL